MDPKSHFSFLICSSNSQLVVRRSNVKNPAFHKKVLALSIYNSHFLCKHIHIWELHIWMEVTQIERVGGGVSTSPQDCSLFPRLYEIFKCVILYWKPYYSQRIFALCKLYWWLVWSYFTNNENKEHKFTKVKSLFCDNLTSMTKVFTSNKSLYDMLWGRMKWSKKAM